MIETKEAKLLRRNPLNHNQKRHLGALYGGAPRQWLDPRVIGALRRRGLVDLVDDHLYHPHTGHNAVLTAGGFNSVHLAGVEQWRRWAWARSWNWGP